METKFVIAFIAARVDTTFGTGKPVSDLTQDLAAGILHHRHTERVTNNPKHAS